MVEVSHASTPTTMDAIAEPRYPTRSQTDHPDTPLSFSAWTQTAVDCLREHWPATDARQLQGIAIELFSDPESGLLAPREAVEQWMHYLGPGAAPGTARRP